MTAMRPPAALDVHRADGVSSGRVSARPLSLWLAIVNLALASTLALSLFSLTGYRAPSGLMVSGGTPTPGLEPVYALHGGGSGPSALFERPMAVAFGKDGAIYVADTGNHRVIVFGDEGGYRFEHGGFGALDPPWGARSDWTEGRLNRPTGIDVDENGYVFVADSRNGLIQVFDERGRYVELFAAGPGPQAGASAGGAPSPRLVPIDVAVAGGAVFALDAEGVWVFGREGGPAKRFGRAGSGPGEFIAPAAIEATADGRVFVVDTGNRRVQALTRSGEFLWEFAVPAYAGAPPVREAAMPPYPFVRPTSIAVHEDGRIAVSDPGLGCIALFTSDGVAESHVGVRGTPAGFLHDPVGVAWSGERIAFCEMAPGRVQVMELAR